MPLYDDAFRQLIANVIRAGVPTADIVKQVSRRTKHCV
jgi:hypothetical protein